MQGAGVFAIGMSQSHVRILFGYLRMKYGVYKSWIILTVTAPMIVFQTYEWLQGLRMHEMLNHLSVINLALLAFHKHMLVLGLFKQA